MPGFANVSNMTSRQIQRMGHADDSTPYRAKTRTQKVTVNYNADDVWSAACAAQRINGSYVKLSSVSESDPATTKLSNRMIVEQLLTDQSGITDTDREHGKKVEPVHMKHYASEQVSIIRQSSIKSAVELMSGWVAKEDKKYNPQQLVELTLLAAAEFEKWVLRDESETKG